MTVTQQDDRDRQAHAPAGAIPLADAATTTALAAMALLAGCGGGGDGGGAAAMPDTTATSTPQPVSAADAARFLQQAQFSSTEAQIAEVRQIGCSAWLARQFEAAQGQTGWAWIEARGYGQVDGYIYYRATYSADFMLWSQLMSAPDAMRKRMALTLSEFFVVSLESSAFSWRSHAFTHYWDTLVKNAFGNFRQLLEDVTLHPAMGYYLNMKGNQKENLVTGRVPDENYAREVMQLFTIGLYELNPNGTERLDASGHPIETYTQSDVTNLARVFTGYDLDRSDGVRLPVPGETTTIYATDFARKPMAFNASRHSTLAATFLGVTIAANTPGPVALKTALDTLFNHPNAGPFFARQMIQRLVTSSPSPGYVGRVAARFSDNGAGVRGDLRAVWSAIVLDEEARGAASLASAQAGKLREPMLRLIQWARTFGATSAAGSWKIVHTSNPATQLGQSPLRSPSVFNFFRPGFVPPGTAMAAAHAPAPEFQLVNETTVGGYLNFMQGVIRNGIACPAPDVPQVTAGSTSLFDVQASYANELPLAPDAAALVAHLGLVLCAGQLSAATQSLIVTVLEATPLTPASSDAARRDRVAAAVLMVMASADYLIQK